MRTGTPVSTTDGPKRSAVDSVYAALKHDILTNSLPAGYQAYETEISDRLGISRTPVREAIIHLEAEGLIEILPRRGFRVLPVRSSDMAEIYEILSSLEPLAAGAVTHRSPDDVELSALESAATEMEDALAREDLNSWAVGDDRFHRELLRLHGNARLISVASALFNQAHRAQMVTLRMRSLPTRSNSEHRHILRCIRKGQPLEASEAMRRHRQRGGQELLDILETYGLPPL